MNRIEYDELKRVQVPPAFSRFTFDARDRNIRVRQPVNNFILDNLKVNGTFTKIGLDYMSLFLDMPNINPNNHNISVVVGSTQYDLVLADGYYNIASMKTALLSLLNTIAGQSWSISTDPITNRFTISNSNAFYFVPSYGGMDMREMLGIDIANPMTPATIQTFFYPPTMLYTQYIDIVSNTLNKFVKVRDSSSDGSTRNLIARVATSFLTQQPINDSTMYWDKPFTVAYEVVNMAWLRYSRDEYINTLDISLLDDKGLPLQARIPHFLFSFLLTED